jgi:hypothetical protein
LALVTEINHMLRLLIAGVIVAGNLLGQSWYNAAWQYRKAKIVDHRRVLASLQNFPVYIAADNDRDLAGHLKSSCQDFLVTLPDATKLAHEILACDAEKGTVHAFVRVPSLSSTADTTVLLYYGNPAATDQSNRIGVWDSTTKMVLNFVGGALADSSSNGISAKVGGGAPKGIGDSPIGPGLACSGIADRLTTASVPVGKAMTLSFWFRADMRPTERALIVPLVGNSNVFGFSWDGYSLWAQSMYFNWNGGSNPIWAGHSNLRPTLHRWYFEALSWNGTTVTAYTDGGVSGTGKAAAIDAFMGGLNLCGDPNNQTRAQLAHVELDSVGRSAAWIATKYANQAHPEWFFRSGSQQSNTRTPRIDSFTASYTTIESGKPTLLQWTTADPTSLSIDNGVGAQTQMLAGSALVRPRATTTYTLTLNGSITAAVTVTVPSGAVAYLRTGAPASTWLRTFTTNASGHAVIKTFEPHNLVPGDYVSQAGFATADAGNTHFHASNLNGKFIVNDVIDSTSYTVTDFSDAYVDPNDMTLAGIYGMGQGWTYAARVTPMVLVDGARGTFDGLNGPRTRRIGTSTNNGLTSLVVSGGIATVTLGYAHSAAVGKKVSVWGTTSSGDLIGEHTIRAVASNTYQFSTTAANGTYTTNAVCGPARIDPHAIGGTDNCVVVSLWATSDNPNWGNVKARSDAMTSAAFYKHVFDGGSVVAYDNSWAVDYFQNSAIRFWVDRKNQGVLNSLIYIIQHFERYTGVNFIGVGNDAGNINHYGERLAMGIANVYTVARTLGHLTPEDKTTAAGKILNEITDPSAQCTRPTVIAGTGMVTASGSRVTGSGTSFTRQIHAGDAIQAGSSFAVNNTYPATIYYVSAIADDTHLTAVNGGAGGLSASPQNFVIIPKWVPGNCGYSDELRWQSAALGVQPSQYGGAGGINTGDTSWHNFPSPYENTAGLLTGYDMMVGAAFADDDPRGIRLFELGQNFYWDSNFRTALGLRGFNANGVGYGFGNEVFGNAVSDIVMYSIAPSLSRPDPASSYFFNPQLEKLYLPYPDQANGVDELNVFGASSGGYPTVVQYGQMPMWLEDSGWMFQPDSNPSKWLKSWTNSRNLAAGSSNQTNAFFFQNPFVTPSNYIAAPLQARIGPNATQIADCVRLTGWNADWGCGAFRSDGFISKTSWTDRSATQVVFLARSGKLGYDRPQPAALSIYAVGTMIYDDSLLPPGNGPNSYYGANVLGNMDVPTIGVFPSSTLRFYESTIDWLRSRLVRWAGDAVFGDAQGRYVYAMADMTESYSPTYNRIHRHIVHFKKSGAEEIVVSRWDIDATNYGTPNVSVPTFFTQNGDPGDHVPPSGDLVPYTEGTTVCPGAGGCDNLNIAREVFSHGNGAAADAHGPGRTTGVITKWFSPGTVTVTWDGSNYGGANRHAFRVTSAAKGGVLDLIEVHKITRNYTTDSMLTASPLNPDANWTGVQTADKVALFARRGILRNSLSVTTTYSGTAQYLIAGLAAGTYTVTLDGRPIAGSPFKVADEDNSLYFESAAGAVSISRGQ